MTEKRHASPPIYIFVRSSHGMVELFNHWDISRETGSQNDGWVIHAAVARCVFDLKTHFIDEVTRERYEHRHTGDDDVSSYSFFGPDRYCTHGISNIFLCRGPT